VAVSFSAARSAKLDRILASCPKPYESDLLQVMTGERSHTSGGYSIGLRHAIPRVLLSAALAVGNGAMPSPRHCIGVKAPAMRGLNGNRLPRYGRTSSAKAGSQR
jgi:hypothetical protein